MSLRQLRKLRQRETEQASLREEKPPQEEGSEEEAEEEEISRAKPSLFASLAALQDEGRDEGDSEQGDGDASEPEDDTGSARRPANKELDLNTISANKATKSKKKKKKKKKGKNTASNAGTGGATDDIDAALRELNIHTASREITSRDPATSPHEDVLGLLEALKVNTQQLKVANEMRNLFGRTAIENLQDAEGDPVRGGRRIQRAAQQQANLETALKGHHAVGKGLPDLILKRNVFIQGKEEWPKAPTGGLTMATNMHADNLIVAFNFMHSQAYQTVQQQFNLVVEMGDPQTLVGLLQRNPYHISSLLQVSKIAKDEGNHALSSDLLERALFTFGRAAQSLFGSKLAQGQARLSFSRPENRELWLAGYHYIRSLMMKGTYRTALEWAKLLFALDPHEDPYCMSLMIHHLAIRAHEFQYLLDFSDEHGLGHFSWKKSQSSPSVVLAALHLKQAARCRSELQQSIQNYPWLFCQLFQELNLAGPPPSIWGIVPRTDAEALFSEIYVRQTKDLWNTPEATSLLMEVTHAMEMVHQEDVARLSNNVIDLNVARFVYLDNTPALMALVPSDLLHRMPTSDSDPLPPPTADHFLYGGNGQDAGQPPLDDLMLQLQANTELDAESDGDTAGDAGLEEEPGSNSEAGALRRLYQMFFGRPLSEMAEIYDEANAEHE